MDIPFPLLNVKADVLNRFRDVARILSRVLFPQRGQRMNSVFSIPVIWHPDPYLSASFLPDIFGLACCEQGYQRQSKELPLKL